MFEILVKYMTGDSFGSRYTEDTVGCIWKDIEYAKLALKYIKEHHEMKQELESETRWGKSSGKANIIISSLKSKPWYVAPKDKWSSHLSVLKVPVNEEEWQQIYPFWHGYFERLESIEIIAARNENESDTKYSF